MEWLLLVVAISGGRHGYVTDLEVKRYATEQECKWQGSLYKGRKFVCFPVAALPPK